MDPNSCLPTADRAVSTSLPVESTTKVLAKSRTPPPPPSSRLGSSMLTPPSSPHHSRSSSEYTSRTDINLDEIHFVAGHRKNNEPCLSGNGSPLSYDSNGKLDCPFEVEFLKDIHGRNQILGRGAWSTVFRGMCRQKATSGFVTPPLSTVRRPPFLVAIKQPSGKDAAAIIENEAKILDYLMGEPSNERYIVPFYGVLPATYSIVLAAMPNTLENHIKESAIAAQASRTTWNMTEPVIGNTSTWLNLTYQLVSALCWLHNQAMVVHGDIKPSNILLDGPACDDTLNDAGVTCDLPYGVRFADFSSSQKLHGEITPNTLSAITREYTAPELLSSKVLSNPNSVATRGSDVFSLAVTLLVAATGNTMVYSGSMFQRQAMAIQGWMVIQTVRNGPLEQGARLPRQGVVERALEKAVLREGMGRIDAARWKSLIEVMRQAEPTKH